VFHGGARSLGFLPVITGVEAMVADTLQHSKNKA
jgi:hypothetical protein